MDSKKEEAIRAKALAEKQFLDKNFHGAKNYALKAQTLCPELEGVSQMVATFSVYTASEEKLNGELDFYSILGVDPSVERSKLKKQYKKLAVLLHPDKNRTVGAEGAFRLVSEAWTLLSDGHKRSSYDQRRNLLFGRVGGYEDCHKVSSSHCRLDTFWTVCTSCHVQYEYLRKYVNKRLSCKNCRGVFVAVETGLAPYSNYSHGYGFGYTRTSPGIGYCAPNGHSKHHVEASGLSAASFSFGASNGYHQKVKGREHVSCNGFDGCNESSKSRRGRATKKRKEVHSNVHGQEENSTKIVGEHGNITPKAGSAGPVLDIRQLLLEKARAEICRKLQEIKRASEPAVKSIEQPEQKKTLPMSITVPDSDFHDFDQGRTEECFRPRQIWALYDEEDGMPRLYCLIREVISLQPFKISISYLTSRYDTEFGSVQWLESGFTKSCGSFRVFHSETVDQVNIFSHLLTGEKAGRGGCVRIYPKSGEIWAIYRNWSPDWNKATPQEVRHQYEMVEVLHDFSEETGVWIAPLTKLHGFKTVYQRDSNSDAIRCIPKREMLRFSHQVPACSLKSEGTNLPDGCWDLDPAATPDELLQLKLSNGVMEETEEYHAKHIVQSQVTFAA